MFRKIRKSTLKPSSPLLIWDGECKFCQYWILRLRPYFSSELNIEPYQKIDVKATGIAKSAYAEAARLIDIDGAVYSGPEVFYKAIDSRFGEYLLSFYNQSFWFRSLNDHFYHIIAQNRALFFRITKWLWGKNPRSSQPYWAFYLSFIIILLITLSLVVKKR